MEYLVYTNCRKLYSTVVYNKSQENKD